MALHSKDDVRTDRLDDIYTSADLAVSMPKYRFPEKEHAPRHAYGVIHDELMLDGNSRQNLATFCQTWAEPEVHRLMDECLDKNMIDKDEYPQTAEIEARCVHMLADLWNAPDAANTLGCSTTGSSEAAMLGGMAMKWRWRKRMKAQGRPTDKPNLITGPVQTCWHKFTRYWDVEHREIPMEHFAREPASPAYCTLNRPFHTSRRRTSPDRGCSADRCLRWQSLPVRGSRRADPRWRRCCSTAKHMKVACGASGVTARHAAIERRGRLTPSDRICFRDMLIPM
jgi:hypothetical protein